MASSEHLTQWITPPPVWDGAGPGAGPALLRFASDSFMDEILALLENEPARLPELLAQPETWRTPLGTAPLAQENPFRQLLDGRAARPTGLRAIVAAARKASLAPKSSPALPAAQNADLPLKLFQPAHQRYYLVTACLVCGVLGLPDRVVNAGAQERVSFVVRRLLPPPADPTAAFASGTWEEHALVDVGRMPTWQRAAGNAQTLAGEEKLPVFPLAYPEADGRRRRIFGGLVPVGRREAYMGAARAAAADGSPQPALDSRAILFWTQVREPWQRLAETAAAANAMQHPQTSSLFQDQPLPAAALAASLKAAREQIQTGSWYVLLDFAGFLQQHLPDVWAVLSGTAPAAHLTAAQKALVSALSNTAHSDKFSAALASRAFKKAVIPRSLKEALLAAADPAAAANLEQVSVSYDSANPVPLWPAFLFPLADPAAADEPGLSYSPDEAGAQTGLERQQARINHLARLVENALPEKANMPLPAIPLAARAPQDQNGAAWFVIRMVFERPNCGPLAPEVLSAPSRPFQLASFFDEDAPARPVRISLPVDTSPAGLRKFDKNTAFVISDMLCGQINRAKGLGLGDLVRSVLPWPFHKDLSIPDGGPCADGSGTIGMICSLSIPIITICALILLMIIVSLLDLIFRWIPFFIMCFPLPGLKAKENRV
jgi:hypothetical protein